MNVKFDNLVESLGVDEELKSQINEAWESQLNEARKEITAELREEFAQKYEHDKATMVKSMNSFITERVKSEVEEFAADKKAIAEERVKAKTQLQEQLAMFKTFIAERLAGEIRELREDRENSKGNLKKLEEFVLKQLAEEVKEFHSDKQALVEQRVKLVRESKQKLSEAKQQFIKKAAKLTEQKLGQLIRSEIKQYRDDIENARKNDFGRRMFEAFAGEYMTSFLNENGEVKKLQKQMEDMATQLEETKAQIQEKDKLLEGAQSKIRAVKDQLGRDKLMTELLSPLSKRQRGMMEELLENVKTANLREGFKKYLPAVLNENTTHTGKGKTALKESVRSLKSGDRSTSIEQQSDDADYEIDMNQLRKLAGINSQK